MRDLSTAIRVNHYFWPDKFALEVLEQVGLNILSSSPTAL